MHSQGSNSNFTKRRLMGSPAARKSAWESLHCMERADNLGKVTQLRPRSNELGQLDLGPRRRVTDRPSDPDRSQQALGYALLAVTFVIFAVLLWPYIAERFA